MSTIDLICEACGETNPAGTEFCKNCNSYLAWDRSVLVRPPAATPPPAHQQTPAGPTSANTWVPEPAAGHSAAPEQGPVPQNYPDQNYPDQGYVDQGYVEQGYDAYGSYAAPGSYDPAAAASASSAATLEQSAYEEVVCPVCGRVDPATRRFCSHCGYGVVESASPDPYAATGSAWAATAAARDRAARREYRRSLPPLYRWRRVIIGVLVVALLVGLTVVLHSNPVGVVKDAWYALNKDYVKVTPIRAGVVPASATAAQSDPANLVDGTAEEWTMNWAPSQTDPCGPATGTGVIVLTFAPTRIRQLQIVPGLDQSNPQRSLQPLPRQLGISFDNGPCHPVTLKNTPKQPVIPLDSGVPVSQVTIGIGSAYPAAPDALPLISLTEVILQSFPS